MRQTAIDVDIPGRLLGIVVLTGGLLAGSPHAFAQAVLKPPAGNRIFLTTKGAGTQDYICLPTTTGDNTTAWTFERPQATLSIGIDHNTIQAAQHFLSTVPGQTLVADAACVESGAGARQLCPSWQSPFDQSQVWGEKIASENAGSGSDCPNNGSIPCLLLKSVATTNGQFGGRGVFGAVTFIERSKTSGGMPPTTVCRTGQIAQVPYTADYLFYQAAP